MNIIQKSESIRANLRKGFQDGTSKMAQRNCYGFLSYLDRAAAKRPGSGPRCHVLQRLRHLAGVRHIQEGHREGPVPGQRVFRHFPAQPGIGTVPLDGKRAGEVASQRELLPTLHHQKGQPQMAGLLCTSKNRNYWIEQI